MRADVARKYRSYAKNVKYGFTGGLLSIGKDRARISWGDIQRTYRRHLYMRGQQKGRDPEGRPVRQGFTPEQIQAVVKADGRLPLQGSAQMPRAILFRRPCPGQPGVR